MPLTALVAENLLDATSCTDEEWTQVHRTRPSALLTCRGCGGSMHAKKSRRGLRFFAHDQLQEHCPSTGETAEHLWLKAQLAELVRGAGWKPVIEATPPQMTSADGGPTSSPSAPATSGWHSKRSSPR